MANTKTSQISAFMVNIYFFRDKKYALKPQNILVGRNASFLEFAVSNSAYNDYNSIFEAIEPELIVFS